MDNTHLYWGHFSGTIRRSTKAPNSNSVAIVKDTTVSDLVLHGAYVYWLHRGSLAEESKDDAIYRARKDGSDTPVLLVSKQKNISGLAVDDTHIYWTDETEGTVVRHTKVGPQCGSEGEPACEVLVSAQPEPIHVSVDDEHVFWSNKNWGDVGIGRIAKAGGPIDVLVTSTEGVNNQFVLDSTHVYFARDREGSGATIRRVAKAGGPTERVYHADFWVDASLRRLAVQGDYVYWTGFSKGGVWRVPKTGGDALRLVKSGSPRPFSPFSLVVDDQHVYFSSQSNVEIVRVPR